MRRLVPVLLLLSAACGPSDQRVEVAFAAVVGTEALECEKTYAGLGTKSTSASFIDVRFFVTDLTLVDAKGKREPLKLEQDGKNQLDATALVTFCGAPANTKVVGRVPMGFTPAAVEFDLGFPEAKNHLDATTAKAPLNEPGMWWSWTGGFKFLRADAKVPGIYYLHLGASGCDGEPSTGYRCKSPNLAHVRVESLTVTADLAALYAQSDLTAKPDMVKDFVPGCMSDADDPDCVPVLGQLGLGSAAQVVFK